MIKSQKYLFAGQPWNKMFLRKCSRFRDCGVHTAVKHFLLQSGIRACEVRRIGRHSVVPITSTVWALSNRRGYTCVARVSPAGAKGYVCVCVCVCWEGIAFATAGPPAEYTAFIEANGAEVEVAIPLFTKLDALCVSQPASYPTPATVVDT